MKKFKAILQLLAAVIIAFFGYNSISQPSSESADASKTTVAQQETQTKLPQGKLKISVLDVGQGDAILLQDGKQNIMVDVGNDAKDKIGTGGGREALIAALDKADVQNVKTVILTHHHRDHMGNIMYVRGKYSVSNILDNGFVNSKYTTSVKLNQELNSGLYNNKVLKAGDRIDIDKDYYLEVLAPGNFIDKSLYSNINNTSIVMMLHYGKFSMLLTGDAEAGVEDALQKKYGDALKADVLKVGHHGSKTSSYWEFINKVKPAYALISCGHHDIYNHPNEKVVGRLQQVGAKVMTTYDHGTLTVTTDGKSFDVKTER